MGEHRRRPLSLPNGDGAPGSLAHRAAATLEAKLVVGCDVDAGHRTLLLKCRGPLDASDTVVAFTYAQLKHYAAQMATQEAELELAAIGGKPLDAIQLIQLEAIGVIKVRVSGGTANA